LNHRLKLWVSNAFREIFQVHIHISSARKRAATCATEMPPETHHDNRRSCA
jgi:hypothetical protein